MEKQMCGAKTRAGTPCRKTALKNGRCKLHGGKSTGPKDRAKKSESMKGNKNALKHGMYETIWFDTLTEEEKELFEQVPTDSVKQVENEFRLSDIRIRRMLQRIKAEEEKDKPNIKRINAIEEAITKVQTNKANLIKENSRLLELNNNDGDNGTLDQLVGIIAHARQKYNRESQGD